MELKKYQQKTIEQIEKYLQTISKHGPNLAFYLIKNEPYKEQFFGEVPFICVKIPTGGGKTLVGCNAVTKIQNIFLKEKREKGLVLWFVPSEAIKSQTLKKFKDKKDSHRKILDEQYNNNVKIFSNEEALKIKREDIEDNLCIVISSIDAFRKEDKIRDKYKVYKENGSLINHFENINEELKILEKDDSGIIKSLANVIRMNNPLIVIDEGHKTKTQLSVDFLKDLNPSFIIEYTATPRPESNILVEIHSSELKFEEMVKLPLVLQSHTQWQEAIIQGILRRDELETIAKKERENIRPIALIQAESDKKEDTNITVFKIKDFLINERKIPEEEIAISYKDTNEILNLDLFDKNCKIRYIITVNKLAEGWDCPFAYVLISVANIGSKIAVEQIIGRIMRMPYVKRKTNESLNRSYVFASARNFNEAASIIISGLESNGYSKHDVINANEKKEKNELIANRRFTQEFSVPYISLENEKLTFEDLIGEEFELSKHYISFDFKVHYDNDGKVILDVVGEDKWFKSGQQILKLTYKDKTCSKEELVQWLDKKLRYSMIEKEDKVKFLSKVIDNIKEYNTNELSINRYALLEQLDNLITEILTIYSKKRFEIFMKDKKIKLKEFEKFPNQITLNCEIPIDFNKNYYEKIEKLNKEEMAFLTRLDLDSLQNIKFWIRNREKQDFYLQGWQKNKFYPDFIALTNEGNILLLEWKGADRISNEDTKYKEEIAKIWEELGKGKLYFFLVHTGNIEEVLLKIKGLK